MLIDIISGSLFQSLSSDMNFVFQQYLKTTYLPDPVLFYAGILSRDVQMTDIRSPKP